MDSSSAKGMLTGLQPLPRLLLLLLLLLLLVWAVLLEVVFLGDGIVRVTAEEN